MKPSPLHIGENDKVMEKEDANPQVPSGQKPGNSLMKLALFWLFFFAPAVAFLFLIPDESLNMIGWIMIPIYFVLVLISYLISRNTSERGTGLLPGPTNPVTPLVFLTTYHVTSFIIILMRT